MRYFAVIICLFLFSCTHDKPQNQEKIRVTGEGKIRAKPDQVTLTLQVAFTRPKMADAVSRSQQTVDSVVTILKQFSASENDIKTSSISANKEYSYGGRTPVFTGYNAQQSINFVLNDISKFTQLTEKLLQTKISSISQIQFGHSKTDSLLREADLLAYDDAFRSAAKLSKRANVKLGRVLFMSNTGGSGGFERDGYGVVSQEANMVSSVARSGGFRISPEVMEFRRTIVSEYEIIP